MNLTQAQHLDYRLGQVIVQFNPDFNTLNINALGKRSKNPWNVLRPKKQLGKVWNIWLFEFDHVQHSAAEVMKSLRQEENVIQVQRNHLIHYRLKPNDPLFPLQWHHLNNGSSGGVINADFDTDQAWDLCTGGLTENLDSIVICIIDDGLEIQHEDIQPNMWRNSAEIPGNGVDDDQNGYTDDFRGWNTFDQNDLFESGKHGTAVTGLAAAKGNNGVGISGIAWSQKIMFVAGGGDEANAIESYAYPLQFRRLYNNTGGKKGAFVVATNTSWGADLVKAEDSPIWCAVYDILGKEGILNVASTTNQNIDVDAEGDMPTTCISEYLVTTTNITDQNVKRISAGYGKVSIDLGAYGESTYSTYINNTYRFFGGTSASAPQVTGTIGLLYALPCSHLDELALSEPSKAALEVKSILLQSVKANPSLKDITVTGGILNIFNALLQVSPLKIESIGTHHLQFNWQNPTLYPVQFRYRQSGQLNWKDTTIYQGNSLVLSGLEPCTDYELQIKNLCARFSEHYSPIQIIKSAGCCDPIKNIKILNDIGTRVALHYTDPSSVSELTALLKKSGTNLWDTFNFKKVTGELIFDELEKCTAYELLVFSTCNGKPSSPSQLFSFTTSGCESCTELEYCKRFRPSSELEWLQTIEVNQLPFISGNNAGYGNYVGTNQNWTFEKSKTYSITFKAGYLSDTSIMVAAAWIDYNQDGYFDDAENFALPTLQFKFSIHYNLQIPTNARSGWTRMRVVLKFAEFSSTTPLSCFQSLEFGEYEEYCVYITDGLCPEITQVDFTDIQAQSVQLLVNAHQAPEFGYAYRKLYQSDWFTGVSHSRIIRLEPLDSCSKYQLKIVARCANQESIPTTYYFQTRGTDCTVANEDHPHSTRFHLYPNPCSDHAFAMHPDATDISQIECFDLKGRHLQLKFQFQEEDRVLIETSNLKRGFYIIKIRFNNGLILNQKLLKI